MQVRNRIAARFFHALAFVALSVSLAAPAAHGAEKKRAVAAKKPAVSATEKRPVAKSSDKQARKTAEVSRGKSARVAVTLSKGKTTTTRLAARSAKAPLRAVAFTPPPQSFGKIAGLHEVQDPLSLQSSVALVIDQDTQEVLLSKNEGAVLPIASLTKLMTGLLVSESRLDMNESITITQDDVDTEKFSRSRLSVGTTLTRGELMHLALMSSENRAAHALGRTYPGGLEAFVARMNAKARQIGMRSTHYVEPTGLSSGNQSSARDLAQLVSVAHNDALLRELTTSPGYEVEVGSRTLQFNNTNRLVKSPLWDIGLQKTGFINEAGRCLVMQAQVSGRKLIMVFLDSAGKFSRLADAERVRTWVEQRSHPAGHMLARTEHGNS
ncbi:D-alanyl-D-alanine carboxypeptidase family protein [Diaphorobacter aerolatus]|uniref:Serine hydrolase n=1 Tax=Diaphorobacter aerolatus TaxID=1288495 RepID=A0A7H0GL98_9BURK|nr:serine hydrolase [Diaphorobacter aerolatus]QNP49064.1 serine hydrolase [Diaphorobacter aerolatus]